MIVVSWFNCSQGDLGSELGQVLEKADCLSGTGEHHVGGDDFCDRDVHLLPPGNCEWLYSLE